MVEQVDNLLVSEVEAYAMLSNFLEGAARDHFVACERIGSSSPDGAHDFPTAVQCLLESCATNEAINEAISNCWHVKQRPKEDEQAFHTRFLAVHTRTGFFMRERAVVTAFIEALDLHLRLYMRAYCDDNPRVGMVVVFRRFKTEGKTIRAAFGRKNRANSSGADYSARFSSKQGGRRQVNMMDLTE